MRPNTNLPVIPRDVGGQVTRRSILDVAKLRTLFPDCPCVGRELLDQLETVGLKGLAFWENGWRQITTTETPV